MRAFSHKRFGRREEGAKKRKAIFLPPLFFYMLALQKQREPDLNAKELCCVLNVEETMKQEMVEIKQRHH